MLLPSEGESLNDLRRTASAKSGDLAAQAYGSTQVEQKVFVGSFRPSVRSRLALHSDDGCRVLLDGREIHNRFQNGQDLSNMSQSFHELGVVLQADTTYQIRIEYQNKFHMENGDIDGVTMWAYADTGKPGGEGTNGRVIIFADHEPTYHKKPNALATNYGANYSEKNIRQGNGYLTADSVVQEVQPGSNLQNYTGWVGVKKYSAETDAFSNPRYAWESLAAHDTLPFLYEQPYDILPLNPGGIRSIWRKSWAMCRSLVLPAARHQRSTNRQLLSSKLQTLTASIPKSLPIPTLCVGISRLKIGRELAIGRQPTQFPATTAKE